MLTNNKYKLIYRSFFDNFDRDFLIPSYRESNRLYRASGYFSLRSLMLSFDGLLSFIENGGVLNLLCSPELSDADITAIQAGSTLTDSDAIRAILDELNKDEHFSERELSQLNVICNMIAERKINIRIAYMPSGIYHEKYGIFVDEVGNMVYFTGSANETVSAKIKIAKVSRFKQPGATLIAFLSSKRLNCLINTGIINFPNM